MYTVNKGPSKIVAKTRRGLAQNIESVESIKESSKKGFDLNSPEERLNIPRPVFQANNAAKRIPTTKPVEEKVITPQHEEIIRYINDSWNIVVAENPYDCSTMSAVKDLPQADANNNNEPSSSNNTTLNEDPVASIIASSPASNTSAYWVEPPSPALNDFKPFDLETWWGRRVFQNITKNL